MDWKTDYDQIAAEYARNRQVHPQVLEALCQAVSETSRVLEVGCGTGNYAIALASRTGCACWGIDPSAEMLSKARARSSDVRFALGRAECPDFGRGSFDLVFSVDVIHHVQDRPTAFREAHRVLAAGGRVCTVTDSEWILRHRQPLATYFPETVPVELERYPSIAELRAWMEKAGLDEIAESTVECRYPLTDIQAYRDKAFSVLHHIPEGAFRRGIARMERDLPAGPIPCVSRYTMLWGKRQAPSTRAGSGDRPSP